MTNGKVTIKDVYDNVNLLREEVRNTYVTKDEFMPVKQDVCDIQSNLTKGVWLVLSVVIMGILGLLGLVRGS